MDEVSRSMKKFLMGLFLALSPIGIMGQVYHAGEESPETSSVRWEVSIAWVQPNQHVQGQLGETLFRRKGGPSVRGLYYPTAWMGVGVEGFKSDWQDFPISNSYKAVRYGLVSKWLLTPQTMPSAYVLLGAGQMRQRTSYSDTVYFTARPAYGLVGLGLETRVYRGWFVAAEGQAVYYEHSRIDEFVRLEHRWELAFLVRGGIRF